jgi:hypothetical protein
MLKTAHDAEEFMRTGARVSPSWPGGDLRGRIRCSRLISRRSRQNPLQTGRAIRCRRGGPYVADGAGHTFSTISTQRRRSDRVSGKLSVSRRAPHAGLGFQPQSPAISFFKSALSVSCSAWVSDNKSRSSLATWRPIASSIRRLPGSVSTISLPRRTTMVPEVTR